MAKFLKEVFFLSNGPHLQVTLKLQKCDLLNQLLLLYVPVSWLVDDAFSQQIVRQAVSLHNACCKDIYIRLFFMVNLDQSSFFLKCAYIKKLSSFL